MGSEFGLTVIAGSEREASERLSEGIAEIRRIEILLTEFSEDSETALVNRNAGVRPVEVSEEFYQLVQRCLHISEITQGAFDITAAVLKSIYSFRGNACSFPDKALLREKLQMTGSRKIRLMQGQRILLERAGMRIGFGAIGKGYAADRVRALWESKGVEGGVINASGDLTVFGTPPGGKSWKVGIADPNKPGQMMLWVPVQDASIATSGDYEQYFVKDGIRYSHNIDPRSGIPTHQVKTATVVSHSAELSDALATAAMVMGPGPVLSLVDQLPKVHCILVDNQNRLHASQKIKIHAEQAVK